VHRTLPRAIGVPAVGDDDEEGELKEEGVSSQARRGVLATAHHIGRDSHQLSLGALETKRGDDGGVEVSESVERVGPDERESSARRSSNGRKPLVRAYMQK
jgi:hypothetical protein